MHAGSLTPSGLPLALETLRGVLVPPLSIDGPTVGQVVKHGKP
ncbi:hypothetical protein DEDE109153_01065 [Deinococcus deserti]